MEESKTCLCDYIKKYTYTIPQKDTPRFDYDTKLHPIIPYDNENISLKQIKTHTCLLSKNKCK